MPKRRRPTKTKRDAGRHSENEWNARLKALGLAELKPGFLPRRRRAKPILDSDENEIEVGAALNLDGSAVIRPEATEIRPTVQEGAFLKLAEYLNLTSVARTVLGLRLLCDDVTRVDVREFFLRAHPDKVSEAMSAWREFSRRMPEIRAFLEGHRRDREVPTKPRYKPYD